MKRIIIIGILIFTGIFLYGQSQPISIRKVGRKGEVYSQNDKKLKMRQLLVITQPNPEAYKEIKLARSNNTAGIVFLSPCLVLLVPAMANMFSGYTLLDNKTEWKVLGGAAGFWCIALPFVISAGRHTKKGVAIYNNGFKSSMLNNADIRLGITRNGVGMKIRF